MLLSLLVVAGATNLGGINTFGQSDNRPIATRRPYPAHMVDDVRRPGYNGRLWVGRPIIGGIQQGPYAIDSGSPGADAYGAYGDQDGMVYSRVGLLVVGIDPWQSITQDGYKDYEYSRNFWLQEQGYAGGVRTFVNDLNIWKPEAKGEQQASNAKSDLTPRATIQLPADMPRQRRRIRVDAGGPGPARQLVACPGAGPARISWPMTAPLDAVARTASSGGTVFNQAPTRVVTAAR